MLGLEWTSVAEDLCTRPKDVFKSSTSKLLSSKPLAGQNNDSACKMLPTRRSYDMSKSSYFNATSPPVNHGGRLAHIIGLDTPHPVSHTPWRAGAGVNDHGRLQSLLSECTPSEKAMNEAMSARAGSSHPHPYWKHVPLSTDGKNDPICWSDKVSAMDQTPSSSAEYDRRYPKPPISVIKKIWRQRTRANANDELSPRELQDHVGSDLSRHLLAESYSQPKNISTYVHSNNSAFSLIKRKKMLVFKLKYYETFEHIS